MLNMVMFKEVTKKILRVEKLQTKVHPPQNSRQESRKITY